MAAANTWIQAWRDLTRDRLILLIVAVGIVSGTIRATVHVLVGAPPLLAMYPSAVLGFGIATAVLVRRRRQAPERALSSR